MLLFIILALAIIIPTLILHYSQHFTLECNCKRLESMRMVETESNTYPVGAHESRTFVVNMRRGRVKYCFRLVPIDEDFNFFPISFLYYMISLVIIYLIMFALQIIDYITNYDSLSSFNILYNESISWYNEHSIFELHPHSTLLYIGDLIIIYSVLFISMWNSLLIFYRYYTMFVTTRSLMEIKMVSVVGQFCIFGVIYCILFIIFIHLYYWLFPLILIFYSIFNYYCTWKWSAILIRHYQFLIKTESEYDDTETHLNSAYLMRSISLICCTLHSLCLIIFIITYNVDTIYYLSILWSISCSISVFNFIRNRNFIHKCCTHKPHKTLFMDIDVNPSFVLSVNGMKVPSNSVDSKANENEDNNNNNNDNNVELTAIKGKWTGSSPGLLKYAHDITHDNERATKSAGELMGGEQRKEFIIENKHSLHALDLVNDHSSVHVVIGFDPNKRRRSNSVPINIATMLDDDSIDIDKVLRTFNLLSKYGFCSAN